MKYICQPEQCSGCKACINICNKSAVTIKNDELDQGIALIDESKCVNCGMCRQVCPCNNEIQYNDPIKCYAAWTKNVTDQKICASGGMSTTFARKIIDDGGVVFGVCYKDNMKLQFDMAEDDKSIIKFSGSQYVQADTGMIYRKVESVLKADRYALFTGTPCQVDALKHYLGKEYEKLITVDIICHGTPPFEYLKQHIVNITNTEVDRVSFRGENNFYLTLYSNNKEIYKKYSQDDAYFMAFLDGLLFRENCYHCKYACNKRVSDITIGDFWGLEKHTLKETYNGRVSVVLINTDKGNKLFDSSSNMLHCEEREINEAIAANGQLNHPSIKHSDRNIFEENYKKYGFVKAVQTKSIKKKLAYRKLQKNIIYRAIKKANRLLRR